MEANYFKITGIKYYEILNAGVTTNNSLLLSKILDLFHYLLMFISINPFYNLKLLMVKLDTFIVYKRE